MSRRWPFPPHLAALAVLLVVLGGCRGCTSPRPPIHLNPNMDYQPKYQTQEASEFFADGAAMQAPPLGTVALEDPVELDGYATGKLGGGALVATVPAEARQRFGGEEAMLQRGAERYAIYCAVCHGDSGDGRGVLYHRSGVVSGDLRQARLRSVPDGHLFDVISNGLGLMSSYAAQVPVADRWAIIAHVRRLQAEAPVPDAPATEGAAPETAPTGGSPGAAQPAATTDSGSDTATGTGIDTDAGTETDTGTDTDSATVSDTAGEEAR